MDFWRLGTMGIAGGVMVCAMAVQHWDDGGEEEQA